MLTLRGNIFNFKARRSLSKIPKHMIWLKKENDWQIRLTKVSILLCWWIMMARETIAAVHYAFPLCSKQNSAFYSTHWDFVFFDFVWKALYAGCAAKQKDTSTPMQTRCELSSACSQSRWALDMRAKTACTDIVFLGTINVLSRIWFALISLQPSEIQTSLFMHCQKQMFLLVHNGGTFLWRNRNVSWRATCHEGRKNYIYWSMLLILICFVCLK